MSKTIAVALAELRSLRGNALAWLAGVLACGAGLVLYHALAYEHTGYSPGAAPRFALPGIGLTALWVALAGLVFLAADARARDVRERVSDALDARPFSNLALVAGRLLAVVLAAWLPVLLMAAALQAGGALAAANDWRFGVAAEPVSLATFLFVDAPVAMLFWGALVMLLATALRSRLAVAALGLGLLAAHAWALFNTPLYLLPAVSGIANLGLPGSDIVPRGLGAADLAQRCGVVVLALGMSVLAAAALRRRDGASRAPLLACGAVLVLLGGAGVAAVAAQALAARVERTAWAHAHAAVAHAPRLDLERLSGSVSIDPGRELAIAVDLEVRAPDDAALDDLRFGLNPGMQVVAVRVDGQRATFRHELGLLVVAVPERLAAGAEAVVSVEARGVPDPRFGYLDQAFDPLAETLLGSPAVVMGDQASLFDRRYVALMPAVRWLPLPGAHRETGRYAAHPPDRHRIDLAVGLPDGWHAAAPGRRREDAVLRFRPAVALTGFPLLAAPFERRARTMDGIESELLIHPKHVASADYAVEGANAERFERNLARRLTGFPAALYPFDALSLVEVPGQLRRYGGGWLMDAVQAMPGVHMIPEHSFPTRRYAAEIRRPGSSDDARYGEQFFLTDIFGLNGIPLSAGVARNAQLLGTCAAGGRSHALAVLLDFLVAAAFRSETVLVPVRWLQAGRMPAEPFAVRTLHRLTGVAKMGHLWSPGLPSASWHRSSALAVADLDPVAFPDDADIVIHRAQLIALALVDLAGRDKVEEFVGLLQQRRAGGACRIGELIGMLSETGAEAGAYVEHAMRGAGLPGFAASTPRVFRLADDANGQPRYHIQVDVRNLEPAPGVVSLNWFAGSADGWGAGFVVSGHTSLEIGMVAPMPPLELNLKTYLSLNREGIRLPLGPTQTAAAEAPFVGSRPSDWRPADPGIVVDDLDAGFSLVWPGAGTWRLGSRPRAGQSPVAVPEYSLLEDALGWRRQEDELAVGWGRYRRTLVRIPAGGGDASASFATDLPQRGAWRLSYHLPGPRVSHGIEWDGWDAQDSLGTLHLTVNAAGFRSAVTFDGAAAEQGWNHVGTFDLPAGPATVVVTDETDGDVVVADAVRWQPETTAMPRP